jgi:type IX secretion system PorP/SprF family membrane protein
MRKIICISILLFNSLLTFSQDYSFSQFDLNMMYSNPAFAGYENDNRVLLHRRNQWAGIAEKFNSNILELNLSGKLRGKGLGRGEISWAGGLYIIENHENSVIKKYNIGIIPWTFHFQLPSNFFISMGIQNVISYNTLDWDKLIFSDMIDDIGLTGNETSASLPIYEKYTNWFDPSFGFIVTKHSLFQSKSNQISSVGFAVHHLNRVIESFYNNQTETSKLPIKYTIHGEHAGEVPSFASNSFKSWKIFARHEQQAEKVMQKDEIGFSTTLANSLQLELGTIYRIGRYMSVNNYTVMSESIIPLIRMRVKNTRDIGVDISYSYDFNISKLQNINAIATHEFNLNLYFIKRKPRTCPANNNW